MFLGCTARIKNLRKTQQVILNLFTVSCNECLPGSAITHPLRTKNSMCFFPSRESSKDCAKVLHFHLVNYNFKKNLRVDSHVINIERWKVLSYFLYTVDLTIKVYLSLVCSSEHHRKEPWHYHEGLAQRFITLWVLPRSDGFSFPSFAHSFHLPALDSACSQSSPTAFTLPSLKVSCFHRYPLNIATGESEESGRDLSKILSVLLLNTEIWAASCLTSQLPNNRKQTLEDCAVSDQI